MGRMRGIIEEPTDLRYIPSLLSEDQERDLLERVRGLEFDEVCMQAGNTATEAPGATATVRRLSPNLPSSKARTPIRRRTPG